MKPIIFSTPMVRAILDNRKKQTRRVMKPQPIWDNGFWKWAGAAWSDNIKRVTPVPYHSMYNNAPYRPGDIIWVRETWCEYGNIHNPHMGYWYKASGIEQPYMDSVKFKMCKWRPSIYMPREAARIFLRVTNVRVERLQDITEEDARAEGFEKICFGLATPGAIQATSKELFTEHWDALNAKRGYSWHTNPWVWVIEFERIKESEGEEG